MIRVTASEPYARSARYGSGVLMEWAEVSVAESIRRLQSTERITAALRAAELVSAAALRSLDPIGDARVLRDAMGDGDDLTTLAAIHALGAIPDPLADATLLHVLQSREDPFAGHAAWSLAARRPSNDGLVGLLGLIAAGGFSGMLAERTFIEWSRRNPAVAKWRLRAALQSATDLEASRFARVLSCLPGARADDETTDRTHLRAGAGHGLVVIQPFLHARLDAEGRSLGAGDGGGIASLLRSLGNSLSSITDIAEVVTVTRAHTMDGTTEPASGFLGEGHRIERIEFGGDTVIPWREAWQYRTLLEREMVAIGRQFAGRQVVWHLRMAEVGTLAAAAAARRLGQRVVFTAAPDPHIVIDTLESTGRLRRAEFAAADSASQYWFRARMVERLSAQVDHLALLPRPTIHRELVELVGLGESDLFIRSTVVPEGVDIGEIDRAAQRLAREVPPTGGHAPVVQRILDSIPVQRRNLPWVLSIGRLNPLKGPHRLVEAVVGDAELSSTFNVVLVGGDLDRPNAEERSTLESIAAAAATAPEGAVSVVGHLRPSEIADLLVHASENGGLYACASDKEEFGLAMVEALAAGLTVVGPVRGGPLTYVCDGHSGVLCDTTSAEALRTAILQAVPLIADPERAESSRRFVRAELSVERMAARLGELYWSMIPARTAAA